MTTTTAPSIAWAIRTAKKLSEPHKFNSTLHRTGMNANERIALREKGYFLRDRMIYSVTTKIGSSKLVLVPIR